MGQAARSDPREVVTTYIRDVLNRKDLTAAKNLIRNENLKQRVSAFLVAFPDLEVTVHKLVCEGSIVAGHLSGRGTHRGSFQGMPATGKSWSADCMAFYGVIDGRIDDFWVSWDLLSIMEQIGAVKRTEAASA